MSEPAPPQAAASRAAEPDAAAPERAPGKGAAGDGGTSGWAGNLARSWDASYRDTTKILEAWVADEPHPLKVAAATGVQSMMDIGAMLVDVLKLGEGAAQGGWGWAEDAMRLLTVLPALGRIKSIESALRSLTMRPSGNLGALMEQNGVFAELRRLFYDNVGKWARSRYWAAGEGAQGRHLHHWLFPDRWKWVPNGLRQAGFNLMEVSGRLNSAMGRGPWRELKELLFRAAVLILLAAEEWAVIARTRDVVDEHRAE